MFKNRRQTILINRDFQFKLIGKFIAVNILIMILFGYFVYIFFNSEIESNLFSAHALYKNIQDMMLPVIITLSVLNILISSIIIAVFVLFASHKLAGPMYRFNEALKEFSNRNLSALTSLREGDQLYECSVSLKQVEKTLSDDLSGIKLKINELKSLNKTGKSKTVIGGKIKDIENILDRYNL